MMKENEAQTDNAGKMDAVDLIINCLREHENKFDQLLERLEDRVDDTIDAEKLRNYGEIVIEDKRSPHPVNYGQIIKTRIGVDGLEMSTDKGYTICFSDSNNPQKREN